MTTPFWLINPNPTTIEVDYLIIGGGISGLSTAYWLNKLSPHPLKILVIDKKRLGGGASGRNAGFISTGSINLFHQNVLQHGLTQALTMRLFYKKNHDLLIQEFLKNSSNKNKAEYNPCGSVSLTINPSINLDYTSELNHAGFDCKLLSSKEVENKLGFKGSSYGIFDSQDGQLHSYKLLELILDEVQKNGQVLWGEEVFKLDESSAVSNNYKIKFKQIIFALNGYTPLLIPELKEFIRPVRGQIMTLSGGPKIINSNGYCGEHLCYFRQLPKGEVLIGGFRKLEESSEIGYCDDYTTSIIQEAFKNFIKNNFPQLKGRTPLHQWAGIMGFSFDEQPLVGSLSPNRHLIGGYTGHGMGKAFACAEALIKNLLNNEPIPNFINLKRIPSFNY